MTQQIAHVAVHRHNAGAPLVAPTQNAWESGVTFNAAVAHLSSETEQDRSLIKHLITQSGLRISPPQDLVAVLYRGRPKSDPGYLMNRSRIGLALFDGDLQLIHRFNSPVLGPDQPKASDDYLGAEDPRITRIGDRFLMVYCGCGLHEKGTWRATLCLAESSDLLHWPKKGAIDLSYQADGQSRAFDQSYCDNLQSLRAASAGINNKDGTLFPQGSDGWHYLLHRPMIGPISRWAIHLARARSLGGPWEDLGPIMRARPNRGWADAWIGAGATPLPLGDGRYLEIYHTGHRKDGGSRLYTLGAAVMNLNGVDRNGLASVVESRLDHFMVPETRWELEGPYPDSVANVLFACGAYERQGRIYIVYGAGDTYVMIASVAKDELLDALEPVASGELQ